MWKWFVSQNMEPLSLRCFLIQDKTQVLQSSHSRLNSGENISEQVKIICFSWIFNFIVLVFFHKSYFISLWDSQWLEPYWIDMPYFSSFLNSIHMFLAFTILKFINGIPFSSLWRDITHLFNQNTNYEVNLNSMILKLHST